jgi:hypothetical protein
LGNGGVEEDNLHFGVGVDAVGVDRDDDVGADSLDDDLVVGSEGRDVAPEGELCRRRVAGQDVGEVDEVDVAEILEVCDRVSGCRGAVADGVEVEAVDAVAADQRVGLAAAGDDVGEGVAGDGVGEGVAGAVPFWAPADVMTRFSTPAVRA